MTAISDNTAIIVTNVKLTFPTISAKAIDTVRITFTSGL